VNQAALEKLESVQDQLEQLDQQQAERILELQREYNLKKKPFYAARQETIKAIAFFWSEALVAHPNLSPLITAKDEEVLKSLSHINIEDFEEIKTGWKLEFHFGENQFFKNTVLSKQFKYDEEGLLVSIEPSKVDWKANKNYTESEESFLAWFEQMDPDGDAEIAEYIKDVFQSPVKYFLGTVADLQQGDYNDGESEGDGGDDGDDAAGDAGDDDDDGGDGEGDEGGEDSASH